MIKVKIERTCDICGGEMKEGEPLEKGRAYEVLMGPLKIVVTAEVDICKNCFANLVGEWERELRKGGGVGSLSIEIKMGRVGGSAGD